ncbi:MAG TPA: HD domain-containing phosphohydrolase [Gaiella sp.]|nr:HD domain-containing phosphohydrolase [Gaiella sp.]
MDGSCSPNGLTAAAAPGWHARPRIATAIRLLALCGPVAVSVAVVYLASRVVGPPSGSRLSYIGWWAGLSVAATAALVVAGRLSRRLLPLAALMRLSLVFPDSAPSRFRTALQTGTVATLEERLGAARQGEMERTPVAAAQLLLELVAHLDDHDPLTRGHSERVRGYAQSIGRELGLDARELDLLNWAALLHDVGKLEIPHEILAKPGKPTEEEWEILRAHPSLGAELAAPLRQWLGVWSGAIDQHHERWDGTGYPSGLAADDISLAGRIVAVADAFDVITSARSYKRQSSVAEARKELSRCAGTQFDPDVVRAFLAISVRQSRLAAPLAWFAHAGMLARLPVTQASGLTAGAAAAAAVTVGVGATTSIQPRAMTAPPAPPVREATARAVPGRQTVAVPQRPPAVQRIPKRKAAQAKPHRLAAPKPQPATTPRPNEAPAPPPRAVTAPTPPPEPRAASEAPAKSPSAPAQPAAAEARTAPAAAGRRGPAAKAPAAPEAPAPALVDTVTTTVGDVTESAVTAVQDVTTLVTPPPAQPAAPASPAPTPPPAPAPAPPPAPAPAPQEPPSPSDSQGSGSGGLLDGVLSLLDGLLGPH